MIKKKFLFSSFCVFCFLSCQQYEATFEIERNPSITATINNDTWRANDYLVRDLGEVIHYDSPSDTQGEIFRRLSLIGFLRPRSIERLAITLDVKDINNIRGNYLLEYSEQGGIFNIEFIDIPEKEDFYPMYQLCDKSSDATVFTIERQSLEENLISGTFNFLLCERTNRNETTEITEGTFKDLDYQKGE